MTTADIQPLLDQRPGASPLTSARSESDTVEILSGVFEGQTTGAPIALLGEKQGRALRGLQGTQGKVQARPCGFHVQEKYGIRDHRGSGRSRAGRRSAGSRPGPWR